MKSPSLCFLIRRKLRKQFINTFAMMIFALSNLLSKTVFFVEETINNKSNDTEVLADSDILSTTTEEGKIFGSFDF